MTYDYKSNRTMLIKALKASISTKEQSGWSKNIGKGFIQEDIQDIYIDPETHIVSVVLPYTTMQHKLIEYNLGETYEMLEWVQK